MTAKELSSPFSTGGGGVHFESRVQTAFVVLMLAGGFAPCLPSWPISKIKLQGKFAGFSTDDMIIWVESQDGQQSSKMLAQIKHSISMTEGSKLFGEVIEAAWDDFNDSAAFTRGSDVIALITGPLSATDIDGVRTLLEWARFFESPEEFVKNVQLAHFSSGTKMSKLRAFREHLRKANDGEAVSDEDLVDFLRHFHLLGYDLDIRSGVTLSLMHSLIGQYSQANTSGLWSRLLDEVQYVGENAGTITLESLPEELRAAFKQRKQEIIPKALAAPQQTAAVPDWIEHRHAAQLAIANLLGSWDESRQADIDVIEQLAASDYATWIGALREILQEPHSPIALRNGKWRVVDRRGLWGTLATRIFDNHLDTFKECAVAVLTERDPQFELPVDERFMANVHEKVLSYSSELRRGLAETLALLGNHGKTLTNCSQNKPEVTSLLAVRQILDSADWVLWGSLNALLPALAEAAPDEFLSATEKALQQSPSPFDELFSQEGGGITGTNYLTGLLWALEGLAWEESFLVRVCVILGLLASRDPGGMSSNRPANSLQTILLPWLPQTIASIDKRKVALETLEREVPEVAWKLTLGLLPNQQQHSSGTHKPEWRDTIPEDWEKGVSPKDYWEQVSFYCERAVSMAGHDLGRLSMLVRNMAKLPQHAFGNLLAVLSSDEIGDQPEDELLELWEEMKSLVSRHRMYTDSDWALDSDTVAIIDGLASQLEPKNPLRLHRRLFGSRTSALLEERLDWEEEQQKLEELRVQAVNDVLEYGGMDAIIQFVGTVQTPEDVGCSLAVVADCDIDAYLLPRFLDGQGKALDEFVRSYVFWRWRRLGWGWADELEKAGWSASLVCRLLSSLPSMQDAWTRARTWLGESEELYWTSPDVHPYDKDADLGPILDKLIQHGRPRAALATISLMIQDKLPMDTTRSAEALLAAVSSEEPSRDRDMHRAERIIQALQEDTNTNPDSLFRVEWAYLPLLDRYSGTSPKLLHARLASDPEFFCSVMQAIYRSSNEEETEHEPTGSERAIAENAWRLLHEWRTPPGAQDDGSLSKEAFDPWLAQVKEACAASGHLEIALIHVGQVLFHCSAEPEGLWINRIAANALNAVDADDMRRGFSTEAYNSRGAHWVDPTGAPELALAQEYRQKANEVENAGYQRFAATLRQMADSYERDAERVIAEHATEGAE